MARPGVHDYGRDFEQRIEHFAKREGLLCIHHGLRAVRARGGAMVAVRSDLDYRISNRWGATAYFDAKSFAGPVLRLSQLPAHQRALCQRYSRHMLPAGFVVELRAQDLVLWIPSATLECLPAGKPLGHCYGMRLGSSNKFGFHELLDLPWPSVRRNAPAATSSSA